MFIGRINELSFLEERLMSNRFEMIPLYGRRRIGKTRMLEEFIKDKNAIFFTANQFGENSNLESLSESIDALIKPEADGSVYTDFEKAFKSVANYAEKQKEPVVFIMDEYPYLAQTSEGVSSVLQKVIDKFYLQIPNLMVILTGSQLSFMEHQVLGYQSPLYGRRTGQIKLMPLNFNESRKFLPSLPLVDMMTIYGLTGGIPLYLSMLDDHLSLMENVKTHLLKRNSLLYEEPHNLLLQEVRNPARYNDVLAAIANGATEISRIVDKTKLDSPAVSHCLNVLIELHIVEKILPLTGIGKRKPIYKIKDGLFHFWYRYIPRYRRYIETEKLEQILPRIEEDLVGFTSLIFEDFCRDWVFLNSEMLLQEVGAWWGNNPLIKNSKSPAEEVDIIGIGLEKEELAIGECKWRNEKTDLAVGTKLLERSHFFPYRKKDLYIFSKSEFTDCLIEFARTHDIRLITFDEMT